MADIGNVVFDKDAIYISMRNPTVAQKGGEMLSELAKLKEGEGVDERLRDSSFQLFANSKFIRSDEMYIYLDRYIYDSIRYRYIYDIIR